MRQLSSCYHLQHSVKALSFPHLPVFVLLKLIRQKKSAVYHVTVKQEWAKLCPEDCPMVKNEINPVRFIPGTYKLTIYHGLEMTENRNIVKD